MVSQALVSIPPGEKSGPVSRSQKHDGNNRNSGYGTTFRGKVGSPKTPLSTSKRTYKCADRIVTIVGGTHA